MSDETFSRRWLLLSVIGMLTSFLLTIGIAAFGFRGVASADQRALKPTPSAESRPAGGVLLVTQIGGSPARTPTATIGTAPTIRETFQPLAQRFIVNPEPTPGEPLPVVNPEPEPELEPEPYVPPSVSAPVRQPAVQETAPRTSAPANNSAPVAPTSTRVPDPPSQIIPPAATSTPVPRLTNVAIPVTAIATPVMPKSTSTAVPTATVPATSTARAMAVKDQAPTVSLQISDSRVDAGDSVTVVVYGNDDEGLDWISWEGVDAGERALDRESRFECGGRTSCAQSWTVKVSKTGSHTIVARARDSKGLKSDPAYAEIRIKAAPTATPVRTPTKAVAATPTKR